MALDIPMIIQTTLLLDGRADLTATSTPITV
jgi:hypothetical protein